MATRGKQGNGARAGARVGARFCFSRGMALFLGAFALLNLAAALLARAGGLSLWWVDFSSAEHALSAAVGERGQALSPAFQALSGVLLLWWAARPGARAWRRALTVLCTGLFALVAFWDTGLFWGELAQGNLTALVPVPAALALGIAFLVLAVRVGASGTRAVATGARGVAGIVAAVLCCVFAFPLVQVATFGTADCRTSSDCALVPGAQLQADGALTDVLAARVDAGAELYADGRVAYLVMSGGTEESGANEASAMVAYATERGVPDEALVEDGAGISLQAALDDYAALADGRGWDTLMAVSSFYQLPRIKMLGLARGRDIATVPVFGGSDAEETLAALCRETCAWWGCWFATYLVP